MPAVSILLVLSLVLLLIGMGLNALSSSACQKNDSVTAHKYYVASMASSGISAVSMIIAMVVYWRSK